MRYSLFLILLCLPALLFAQEFQFRQEFDTIPVEINGWIPYSPWFGGFTFSNPDFCDLDADGDLDSVVGSGYPILFFLNSGTSINPNFAPDTSITYLWTRGTAAPCLCDIDGDGDLDLFATADERVSYWRNTGTINQPQFQFITDSLAQITWWAMSPALVDIDADGDFDLFTGDGIGTIRFYRNQGTPTNFNFVAEAFMFNNIDVGDWSDPTFVDIDHDGDLDLFIGNAEGKIYFYRNDGTPQQYNFSYVTNNYNNIDVGDYASPEFADVDGDGDYDLFVGRDNQSSTVSPGDIFFYRNIGTPQIAQWELVTKNYLSLDLGYWAGVTSTDINADSTTDLFFSNMGNYISYYQNTGTSISPFYTWITDYYQNIHVSGCNPFFCDIDNDHDPDLFIGSTVIPNPPYPGLCLYQNRGTPSNAIFNLFSNNLLPGNYPVVVKPSLADMDGDNDQDLFMVLGDNSNRYFQNIGTPTTFNFATPITNWQNVFPNKNTTYFFYDIDHDGDLDLFGPGNPESTVWFYRNIGTVQNAHMVLESQNFFPIMGSEINEFNWFVGITITDIDHDGDGDFFLSTANRGGLLFFRNITGDTTAVPLPKVAARACAPIVSISPNPVNSSAVFQFDLPAPGLVRLEICDISGRIVNVQNLGPLPSGIQRRSFDTTQLASGVYVFKVEAVQLVMTGKLVVLK